MKSIPKLIRRFVGIMTISLALLLLLNFIILGIAVSTQSRNESPWDTANEVAANIKIVDNEYSLSTELSSKLKQQNIWAMIIANNTQQAIWQTDNVPIGIPTEYTLSDISDLTRGYINGYPTFTGKTDSGLLVLGYPKDSFWKHTRATWDYKLIANSPLIALFIFVGNMAVIFLIYTILNSKLLRSVKLITAGIQDLSIGSPVHIKKAGILSELADNINKTSVILQQQQYQLRKKETARANWIAGVSHDIRTPLSMVMGYAGQLESSHNLSKAEQKKATAIVKQSERMKNLINDLNLASKLEYDMQPLMKKQENAVAIVRQVVVDFMNMNIDDKFPIEWKLADDLSSCILNSDKELLKRAITNLIQNSINHNENGCTIYISVTADNDNFIICVEDSGVGASNEQIEKLNNAPHYMVCDTNTTEQRHGLGLLIVKQIVSAHQGKMIIDHSTYGGFKVTLSFPKCLDIPEF